MAKEIFSKIGRTAGVFVQKRRKSHRRSKFGFVRFLELNDAKSAIQSLDGTMIESKTIQVSMAKYPFFAQAIREKSKRSDRDPGPSKYIWKHTRKLAIVTFNMKEGIEACEGSYQMMDKEMVGRTIVATLRGFQSVQVVEEFMRCVGWLQIKVASMGARELTIEFGSQEEIFQFLSDE